MSGESKSVAGRRATALATLAALALTTPACSQVVEHRVSAPTVDDAGEITARVEQRRGRRVGTWKPYYTAALLGAIVGSGAMIWTGFLAPNRPLAVTGIVLAATLPVVGSIPFMVKQDVSWTRTRWEPWEPAPATEARLAVIGGADRVLLRREITTADDGIMRTQLGDSLCDAGLQLQIARVDLELTLDAKTPPARTTVGASRVAGHCSPRLSLRTDTGGTGETP
ncbi:MAG: hypothetical protein K1X88_29110 [Nannocystaceae bacterium]|nr:hypothetical protein [Nannocystaceae bacterium]